MIYLDSCVLESLSGSINLNFWGITTNKKKSQLLIQKKDEHYIFKYKLSGEHKTNIVLKKNFKKSLLLIEKIFLTANEKSSPPPLSLARFSQNKKFWSKSHSLRVLLSKIFINHHSLNSFLKKLFTVIELKSFQTIHLFLHEKGKAASRHIEVTRRRLEISKQSIQEFTQLLQAVKKSKNRSFGQSDLRSADFKIIGTCLAQDLALPTHNLVFVLSKDDFLAQGQSDIVFFKKLIGPLSFYLQLILANELSINNSNQCRLFLETIHSFSKGLTPSYENIDEFFLSNINDFLSNIQQVNFNVLDVNHQERMTLLGELLNTLKHELSNPLFGLQLTAELLLLEKSTSEQEEFIRNISHSIKRSQGIIKNFSKIYSINSHLEKIDLITLLHELFSLTKSETRTIKKNIFIHQKFITQKEETLYLFTNQTSLAQVLFNLLINSAQALNNDKESLSPEINIFISIKEHKVEIEFSDNGPGIKQNISQEIFQPFFTTKTSGTGLGLAISRNLIQKLNGKLDYIARDKGPTFLITLPYENSYY